MAEEITDERLKAIEERTAKASPLEYYQRNPEWHSDCGHMDDHLRMLAADDDFIKQARADVPALAAALRAERGETLDALAARHFAWLQSVGWTKTAPLEDLMLVVSEAGEAANECRGETPTEKFGTELADIILRTLGVARKYGVNIGEAVLGKMAANEASGTRGRLK